MDAERKLKINELIDKLSLSLVGLLLLFFPLVFSTQTTDVFTLPKQALVGGVSLLALLLFGIKGLLNNKVVIRRTPFDLPVILFTVSVLLSSVFAVNRIDSFIAFVPLLFVIFAYFMVVNTAKTKNSVLVLLSALIAGALLTSVLTILSFVKIYPLPFAPTHLQTFTTLGALLDQGLYLAFVLPLAAYLAYPFILAYRLKHKEQNEVETANRTDLAKLAGFGLSTLVILAGLLVTIYELIVLQKPVILPIEIGFQTAFAAISQDSGRIAQGFLFGAGYGNYGVVFSRFKQATINLDPNLWSLTFFRSSTFILEILATTGILGLVSFLFLIYKAVKERPLFIPLVLVFAATFVLPFSFTNQALLFFLLGLFASVQGLNEKQNRFFDVELQLVALKKGIISLLPTDEEGKTKQDEASRLLPVVIFVIIVIAVLGFGYLSGSYLISNLDFQKSLVAASQNNGSQTYTDQKNAIQEFGSSDAYYRIFSQTNLSLANSLASSVPSGSTPSAQTTQTVYTLIQQSINSARQATTISPQTAVDWQNLSTIYRSLIGFGQNADSFAILAAQQAITLDPNNPQEYINLGGIYYQLNQWTKAQDQFQLAINLKPDYANAYYNLGHTLIQEGDLKGALTQLQTVKTLVANDPTNLSKINQEIASLQAQINQQANPSVANPSAVQQRTQLNVSSPSATLPVLEKPIKIPAPQISPTPVPSSTATPKPTATP